MFLTGIVCATELPELFKNTKIGNSLAVQWLGLCAFTAKGLGSIPGQGTKIPQATRCGQKNPKKTKNTTEKKQRLVLGKSELSDTYHRDSIINISVLGLSHICLYLLFILQSILHFDASPSHFRIHGELKKI